MTFFPRIALPLFAMLAMAQAVSPPPVSPAPAAPRPAGVAAAPATAADLNAAVRPYLDADTILVGHADAATVDTAGIEAFIVSMMDAAKLPADAEPRRSLPPARLAAEGFLARFKQLGGRHVFLVLDQGDIYPSMSGPGILFKIEPGGNANTMLEFLKAFGIEKEPGSLQKIGDFVALAPRPATLERLKKVQMIARPELALTGEGAIELVGALNADSKRVIQELLPALPHELGDESAHTLLASLENVRLRAFLQPEPRLELVLNHGSAGSGGGEAAWRRVLARGRDLFLSGKTLAEALNQPGIRAQETEARKLIHDLLTPIEPSAPDVTVFQMTAAQMRDMGRISLPSELAKAVVMSQRVESATKIRKLVQACVIYAADNKDQLPAKMEDASRYLDVPVAEAMKDPADPQGRPFVYHPVTGPVSKVNKPFAVPIIWQQMDNTPAETPVPGIRSQGYNIGFLDGHVEFVEKTRAEQMIMNAAATQSAR